MTASTDTLPGSLATPTELRAQLTEPRAQLGRTFAADSLAAVHDAADDAFKLDRRLTELAAKTGTPTELLRQLATHADVEVRVAVAVNSATAPDTLAVLASDEDRWVRRCVAYNTSTPPAALRELARTSTAPKPNTHEIFDILTARYLAANPATPPDVIDLLAGIPRYPGLRSLVQARTDLTAEQQALLALTEG
jgi:hypothetical protein